LHEGGNHSSEVIAMRFSAGIAALAVGFASGCDGGFVFGPSIPGSGIAKNEDRAVDPFHAVDAGNAIQVTLAVTPGAKPSLKISGDDNLVPLIESAVRDGTLILRLKDNSSISPKLPLVADVVTGELDRVEASGAASIKVAGTTKADRFDAAASGAANISVEKLASSKAVASASGASHVVLSGSTTSLKVDASGASGVKADALQADDADVSISGASSATIRPTKSIAGDVSGASVLDLIGHPAKNTVSTSGASQVIERSG
jgi:hypothetical protein